MIGEWMDQRWGRSVHVLMGVRDGAAHLPAQLGSLAAQHGVRWQLCASDDCSDDASVDVLRQFARCYPGRVQVLRGPGQGFAANYLSLLAQLPDVDGAVALADQDDVWLPAKLSRAVAALDRVPPEIPALYKARRWIWTAADGQKRAERVGRGRPAFRNALIENIAPGNTIVMNAAAASLARQLAPLAGGVFAHDWWLYQVITGAGGRVICDPARVLLYRQHGGNAIGAGHGARAAACRKRAVWRGAYRTRITAQLDALTRCQHVLTPAACAELAQFAAARQQKAPVRIWSMARLRPFRQTGWASLGFWGATALGKV